MSYFLIKKQLENNFYFIVYIFPQKFYNLLADLYLFFNISPPNNWVNTF